MTEIWEQLADGVPRAVAVVVRQLRSAPRDVGTVMAVAADGATLGNVTAGCVDGAVHEVALRALADGQARLVSFGVSDEQALGVGLTCGGMIGLVVTPPPDPALLGALAAALREERPVALVTALGPPEALGQRALVFADEVAGAWAGADVTAVAAAARAHLSTGQTGVVEVSGQEYLVQSFAPRPLLLVCGAVAIAEALAALGQLLGYRVVVCDGRPVFAQPERVPSADAVVRDWPHRYLATAPVDGRTVIVSLLHDEKFEIPLLERALAGPAAYVGALGSRATQRRRVEALRAAGVEEAAIARLRAPIGLDLGARSAAETAVSILAEVIALSHGRSGGSLTGTADPIHPRREPTGGAHTVGLVLAAGAGRRFGRPKGLVPAADGGPTWAHQAATRLQRAGCDEVLVVVGAEAEAVAAGCPAGVRVVVAPDWQEGLGASVRAGLRAAAGPNLGRVVVTLVDTPGVSEAAVTRLLAAAGEAPTALARATYGGEPGHPVVLGAAHLPAVIEGLSGDRGAGPYLDAHGALPVECADIADGRDIDTADGLPS
jgi:xanthine dehydrogenase accessory factor